MISRLLVLADSVGVQFKIMGIVLGLVLLLGLGATYELRQRTATLLGRELDERAVSIARDLAARSSDLILTNNTFGLYELARDTLENNRDVRYVLVVGADGAPLVHTFGEQLPAGLVEANAVGPQDRHHMEILDTEEGPMRDVAVPIFEGHAGTARVGLSDRRLARDLETVTRELLLMTGAVSLASLAAAYLLTLLLTRPILDLVRVVRGVERGDLAARVRPHASDEIGVLGHAFNAMSTSLARSHAEREEYNRRLLRRNRELAALNLMASAASHSRTLHEVLDTALQRSLQLTSLAAGWIWLLGDDGDTLRLGAQVGLARIARLLETEGAHAGCACRTVIATGQTRFIAADEGHCAILREGGFHGHLSVPLAARGRTLGMMNLAMAEGRQLAPEELDILGAIGSQIAVAIENARLWEELLRKEELRVQLLDKIIAAQEEERKRIARELHDETSQALTSLIVAFKLMEESRDPAEVRERAREAREITARTLTAIHDLARELRPSALDHLGLAPALERYAHEHAARHAGARHVAVLMERRRDRLVVIVEDDGRGFDLARVEGNGDDGRGLGIFGMRERAALVGGTLSIESTVGGGTTVFVDVPLSEGVAV